MSQIIDFNQYRKKHGGGFDAISRFEKMADKVYTNMLVKMDLYPLCVEEGEEIIRTIGMNPDDFIVSLEALDAFLVNKLEETGPNAGLEFLYVPDNGKDEVFDVMTYFEINSEDEEMVDIYGAAIRARCTGKTVKMLMYDFENCCWVKSNELWGPMEIDPKILMDEWTEYFEEYGKDDE